MLQQEASGGRDTFSSIVCECNLLRPVKVAAERCHIALVALTLSPGLPGAFPLTIFHMFGSQLLAVAALVPFALIFDMLSRLLVLNLIVCLSAFLMATWLQVNLSRLI
ncbi:hypothetical protein MP228_012723 [Amoeboaphelidium protococcarum]|nr:hypothetical protein MP228_012723 [Amoeboaphelidium protococcarum]